MNCRIIILLCAGILITAVMVNYVVTKPIRLPREIMGINVGDDEKKLSERKFGLMKREDGFMVYGLPFEENGYKVDGFDNVLFQEIQFIVSRGKVVGMALRFYTLVDFEKLRRILMDKYGLVPPRSAERPDCCDRIKFSWCDDDSELSLQYCSGESGALTILSFNQIALGISEENAPGAP